jgi:hypothetical protein
MNQYDVGNEWNRNSDSWFQNVWQKAACVACLLWIGCGIVFGLML